MQMAPDVAEMVVQPLQFQKERTQISGAPRHVDAQQRFDRLAIRQTVADRRITGHPLSQWDGVREVFPLKQLLDSTVFPKMVDFQLHDRLAGHGKPEMPRLDDARVDWSNGNLEDPFAFNLSERVLPLATLQDSVPGKVFFEWVEPLGQCSCRTSRRRSGWPTGSIRTCRGFPAHTTWRHGYGE